MADPDLARILQELNRLLRKKEEDPQLAAFREEDGLEPPAREPLFKMGVVLNLVKETLARISGDLRARGFNVTGDTLRQLRQHILETLHNSDVPTGTLDFHSDVFLADSEVRRIANFHIQFTREANTRYPLLPTLGKQLHAAYGVLEAMANLPATDPNKISMPPGVLDALRGFSASAANIEEAGIQEEAIRSNMSRILGAGNTNQAAFREVVEAKVISNPDWFGLNVSERQAIRQAQGEDRAALLEDPAKLLRDKIPTAVQLDADDEQVNRDEEHTFRKGFIDNANAEWDAIVERLRAEGKHLDDEAVLAEAERFRTRNLRQWDIQLQGTRRQHATEERLGEIESFEEAQAALAEWLRLKRNVDDPASLGADYLTKTATFLLRKYEESRERGTAPRTVDDLLFSDTREVIKRYQDAEQLRADAPDLTSTTKADTAVKDWLRGLDPPIDPKSISPEVRQAWADEVFAHYRDAEAAGQIPATVDDILGRYAGSISALQEQERQREAAPNITSSTQADTAVEDWLRGRGEDPDSIPEEIRTSWADQIFAHYRDAAAAGEIPTSVEDFLGPAADRLKGLQASEFNRQFLPEFMGGTGEFGTDGGGTSGTAGLGETGDVDPLEAALFRMGIGDPQFANPAFQRNLRSNVIPRLLPSMQRASQEAEARGERFDLDGWLAAFFKPGQLPFEFGAYRKPKPMSVLPSDAAKAGIGPEFLSEEQFGAFPPEPREVFSQRLVDVRGEIAGTEFDPDDPTDMENFNRLRGIEAEETYLAQPPIVDARAAAIAYKNAITGRGRLKAEFGTQQDLINLTGEFAGDDIPLQSYLLTRLGDIRGPEFGTYVQEEKRRRDDHVRKLLKTYYGSGKIGRSGLASAQAGIKASLRYADPVKYTDYASTRLGGFAKEFPLLPAGKQSAAQEKRAGEQAEVTAERDRRRLLQTGRTVLRA